MRKAELYQDIYARGKADEERFAALLKSLKNDRFDTILDIGCGDGTLTMEIARTVNARDVYGIEIAKEGVAKAKEKGIRCMQADMDVDEIPFPAQQFDFIFCGEVIEHVFDPHRLLAFITKALKPGGKLLITTPNLTAWHCRIYLLLGYSPHLYSVSLEHPGAGKLFRKSSAAGREHIRFFTRKGLADLLSAHGLTAQRTYGFRHLDARSRDFLPWPFSSLLPAAEQLFSILPSFASAIAVLCENGKG